MSDEEIAEMGESAVNDPVDDADLVAILLNSTERTQRMIKGGHCHVEDCAQAEKDIHQLWKVVAAFAAENIRSRKRERD